MSKQLRRRLPLEYLVEKDQLHGRISHGTLRPGALAEISCWWNGKKSKRCATCEPTRRGSVGGALRYNGFVAQTVV